MNSDLSTEERLEAVRKACSALAKKMHGIRENDYDFYRVLEAKGLTEPIAKVLDAC